MSKLTFEMPDMDVIDLANAVDVIETSGVSTDYSNPNIGPWVPVGGNK